MTIAPDASRPPARPLKVRFAELWPDGCRRPIGETDVGERLFCNAEQKWNSLGSYCPHHERLAAAQRKRLADIAPGKARAKGAPKLR